MTQSELVFSLPLPPPPGNPLFSSKTPSSRATRLALSLTPKPPPSRNKSFADVSTFTEQLGKAIGNKSSTIGSQTEDKIDTSPETASNDTLLTPGESSDGAATPRKPEGVKKISFKDYMKGMATGGGSTLCNHNRQPQSEGHNRCKHTGDDDELSRKKPALAGRYIASPKICIPPPSLQHTLANPSQTRLPAPAFH